MTWNKKAGKPISKQKAKEMIDKYQKEHKDSVRSIYFDIEVIKNLIAVDGTAGISIFFAKNDEGQNTLVLLPTDENGRIIYEKKSASLSVEDTALNVGAPCPPYCPTSE